jgi:acyl-coenzyme A synthetase/AMP-(fatty) acid ligase/thioesterase domain-containing protein/acyl carrier protein
VAGTANPASLALREASRARPDEIALQVDGDAFSFSELNAEADRLAQRLVGEYAQGDRIGLRANGTHAIVVGFVAIQRAGMISVQVDPTAPQERVRTILDDVEAPLLLSDAEEDADLPVSVGHPLTFGADADPIPLDRERSELVSIVFTSGSTGVPKGIMVGRKQVDDMLVRTPQSPYLVPGARVGALVGGTVGYIERLVEICLYNQTRLVSFEIRRHGIVPLGPWLVRERIAFLSMVPTVLRSLLPTLETDQQFPDLRMVVFTGETTTWEDVVELRRHLPPEAVILNAFGLTETGAIATLLITSATEAGTGALPAGEISAEASVTIIDEDGKPVEAGMPGEIVVEGAGCSLGYWRRPELTEARFTALPNGYRRIRTGDGGRIAADGTLEHLGRIDFMVKISGNRVELGEVEKELMLLDGVAAAAAATYTDDTQNTRLTACVTPTAGAALDPRLLRASMARRLPGYMIPDHIAVVDALPQLPGGKTDRLRVAELRGQDTGGAAEPAEAHSEIEQTLIEIWTDVLGVTRLGVHDDFFDLGGDSMRAARMFIELERRCGIDRPASLLAEASTVRSLALALDDDSAWGALLALQTSGAQPPLFVVHDGAGSLLYARGLPEELGADQPIYGIRCEGLNGRRIPEESVAALAASYVERMRVPYPHGPYLFYGGSFGGVIAMEMARQLIEAGEEVPLVVLGDSIMPNSSFRWASTNERAASRVTELKNLGGPARARHFAWLLKRQLAHRTMRVIRHVGREERTARRYDRIIDRALQTGEAVPIGARDRFLLVQSGLLMRDHNPAPPLPERVLLIRTGGPGTLPDRGWNPLVGDTLEIVDVPGTHADLGREASGVYVGPVIAEALQRLAVPIG